MCIWCGSEYVVFVEWCDVCRLDVDFCVFDLGVWVFVGRDGLVVCVVWVWYVCYLFVDGCVDELVWCVLVGCCWGIVCICCYVVVCFYCVDWV